VHCHLIHGSLGPHESTSHTASRSVQPFLCSSRQSLYFTMGRPFFLKITSSYGCLDPHRIHGSLGPPESTTHLDRFSRFCGANDCDSLTDTPRYSVCNSRPHLPSKLPRCGLKRLAKASSVQVHSVHKTWNAWSSSARRVKSGARVPWKRCSNPRVFPHFR